MPLFPMFSANSIARALNTSWRLCEGLLSESPASFAQLQILLIHDHPQVKTLLGTTTACLTKAKLCYSDHYNPSQSDLGSRHHSLLLPTNFPWPFLMCSFSLAVFPASRPLLAYMSR